MPETDTELLPGEPTQPYAPMFTGGMVLPRDLVDDEPPSEPLPVPAPSVVVPGNYQYLKRWQFVLVVAAVWVFAAAAGWGLYYWWFHSIDKTPSVFVVLLFVIACTVGGLLIAMVLEQARRLGTGGGADVGTVGRCWRRRGAARRLLL